MKKEHVKTLEYLGFKILSKKEVESIRCKAKEYLFK